MREFITNEVEFYTTIELRTCMNGCYLPNYYLARLAGIDLKVEHLGYVPFSTAIIEY